MPIHNLTSSITRVYTSNVYLILGERNAISDVNTLIDVGRDPLVIDALYCASTGVGKKRIEQVILTHSHFDHAALLDRMREEFTPAVCAFSTTPLAIDRPLRDVELLPVGDDVGEVIHCPGHSNDSICLYLQEQRVLFVGDAPVIGASADSTYEVGFVKALERIARKDVRVVYYGHGRPLTDGCNKRISESLANVHRSMAAGLR